MNYGYNNQEENEDVLVKYGRDITSSAKENKTLKCLKYWDFLFFTLKILYDIIQIKVN